MKEKKIVNRSKVNTSNNITPFILKASSFPRLAFFHLLHVKKSDCKINNVRKSHLDRRKFR